MAGDSLIESHASGELASELRTSRGLVSVLACECSSPVERLDCEIVEMACLKISCSWEPDSSRTENLSKLRMRPVSLAPLRRYTTTEVFSRRTVLRNASWMFCGACLPSDMLKPGGGIVDRAVAMRLQQGSFHYKRLAEM